MECIVSLEGLAPSQHGQVKYAASFIDETISDIRLEGTTLRIVHESPKGNGAIEDRVRKLIDRFSQGDFGFKENILFEHKTVTPYEQDIIAELAAKKIIKVLEPGLFIFREPFSSLMRFFDYSFVSKIASRFEGVTTEEYPAVIHADSLNKTNHFTSFPEHIHFLTHLREDLDIIEAFSQAVRDNGGWQHDAPLDLNANMPKPKFTMNPSTCYHCYEGLQNETLDGDGVVVTAISKCHRFESRNHTDFGRARLQHARDHLRRQTGVREGEPTSRYRIFERAGRRMERGQRDGNRQRPVLHERFPGKGFVPTQSRDEIRAQTDHSAY